MRSQPRPTPIEPFYLLRLADGTSTAAAAIGAGFRWMICGWAIATIGTSIQFKNTGGVAITQVWTPASSFPSSVPLIPEGDGYGMALENTGVDFTTVGLVVGYVFLRRVGM